MSDSPPQRCAPIDFQLKAGKTYWFCACGRSKSGIFCDGSHKSTEFTPLILTADKTESIQLCGCKQSGKRPFCVPAGTPG